MKKKTLLLTAFLAALSLGVLVFWGGEEGKKDGSFVPPAEPIALDFKLTPASGYFLGDKILFEIRIIYDSKAITIDKKFLKSPGEEKIYLHESPRISERDLFNTWKELKVSFEAQILGVAPGSPETLIFPIRYWQNGILKEDAVRIPVLVASLIPPSPEVLERNPQKDNSWLPISLVTMGVLALTAVWFSKIKTIFRLRRSKKVGQKELPELLELKELEEKLLKGEQPRDCLQKLYWLLRSLKTRDDLDFQAHPILESLLGQCRPAFGREFAGEEIPKILENLGALKMKFSQRFGTSTKVDSKQGGGG